MVRGARQNALHFFRERYAPVYFYPVYRSVPWQFCLAARLSPAAWFAVGGGALAMPRLWPCSGRAGFDSAGIMDCIARTVPLLPIAGIHPLFAAGNSRCRDSRRSLHGNRLALGTYSRACSYPVCDGVCAYAALAFDARSSAAITASPMADVETLVQPCAMMSGVRMP